MKTFGEFGITLESKNLQGDKIKIDKILNREITVEAFKIQESKFEGKGKCLYLQFQLNNNQHVCFVGSVGLMEQIQQVPEDEFPFLATIVKENNILKFT